MKANVCFRPIAVIALRPNRRVMGKGVQLMALVGAMLAGRLRRNAANVLVARFTMMDHVTRKPKVTHTAEEWAELRKQVARHKTEEAAAADARIDALIRRNIAQYGP